MDRVTPQMLGLTSMADVTLIAGKPAPEPNASATAQQAATLRRLARTTWRWRWLLAGSATAGLLAGLALTAVMPREYTSVARLEIDRETDRVVNIENVERDASIGDQEFYQTQYGLLRTQTFAERVARDLGVVDDPAFFRMFGYPKIAMDAANRPKRNEVAGKILLAQTGASPVRGSSLVDVRAVTPSPALSQRVARTWADDFIASNLERRFDASSYARKFLEDRLNEYRQKLEDSERDAVNYASQKGIITLPSPSDGQAGGASPPRSLVTDDLGTLNNALEVATVERVSAQSRLAEATRPDAASEALNNNAITTMRQKRAEASADYAKLMIQFQPDYPLAVAEAAQIKDLDASIAQEENRVRTSLQQDYQTALARETSLQARVQQLKGGLTDLNRNDIQYNIYQREADTNRELYDALLQRYKEIGVAGAVENNNIQTVDAAELPERPSSPRLLLNLVLGLLAGGALGAGLAGLLEQIDEGISDPSQLEDKLGLPLLGVIPKIGGLGPLSALEDPKSGMVEAYLAVQANLELATAAGAPKSMAVISTRPKEGKSTTAIALAQSLARARRKVVLVDADMRAPSAHNAFVLKNEIGVSSFLAGIDDIDSMMHATSHDGLTVITAGPQPPNAADLLMGDRFQLLIKRLQERFDHVVVDCPPMIGLADAPLVASAVDGVVYAVEARSAPAAAIRTAVARLRNAQAHVLGVILTKYEAKKGGGYGLEYGYGYGFEYGK